MHDRSSSTSPDRQDRKWRKHPYSNDSDNSRDSSPVDVPLRFSRPIRRMSPSPKRRRINSSRPRAHRNYLSHSSSLSKNYNRSRSREQKKNPEDTNKDWWMMETARFLEKLSKSDKSSPMSRLAPSLPEVITIDDDDDSPPRPIQEGDANLQRKLLGLMYTVEQEMRKNGRIKKIDPNRLKQIYNELGLHITEAESARIMKTIMQSFASRNGGTKINLAAFGIEKQPVYDPSQPPPLCFDPSKPPPSLCPTAQNRVDPELQRILAGIKSDLAKIDTKTDITPVVKPLANRFTRVEDIYKDEAISFAYDPERFTERQTETIANHSDELKHLMKKIEDLKNKLEANGEKKKSEENDVSQVTCQGSFPKKPGHRSLKPKFGIPQGFPQPVIQKPPTPVITISDESVVPSLLHGQKIALPRTIAPYSLQNREDSNYNVHCVPQSFSPAFPNTFIGNQQQIMPNDVQNNYTMNNLMPHYRTDLHLSTPPPYSYPYSNYNANN